MTNEQLANQLRYRLHKKMHMPWELLDIASDESVILSYVTCSFCGEQQISNEKLNWVIEHSQSAEQFMELWPQVADHSHWN